MNSKKISKALSNTNDNCVDEAIANTEKRKSNIWLKVGAIAACFVVLVVAGSSPVIHPIKNALVV